MNKVDLHTHSTYSDGNNTPREIVKFAINKGLQTIGISDHSYTHFDESYCIKKEKIKQYINEILQLKEEFKNDIEVKLGIEQDYYSDEQTDNYDYIIGSVHYIKVENTYISIDESPKILIKACNDYFSGNIYDLIKVYYQTVADVVNKTNADIIGHFDLISKFNENGILFDENDSRYVNAYKPAADILLKSNKLFEINTGAISRKYRTSPYPSSSIYKYLKDNGAKFILSSDSHSIDTLCYNFDKYLKLI